MDMVTQKNKKEVKKKMGTQLIEVRECLCERCGYKWLPRQIEIPINCPNCKSAYWNRPRIRNPSLKLENVK
jgi:predicted Zn-ribbon and HTH transcriptional regulator